MDLIVGDIHGCWDEFRDLLDAAGPGPADRIIAVGDLLDRGPEPRRVLEFFRTTPNAMSVMGNHERKHIAGHEGRVAYALSQRIVVHDLGDDYEECVEFFRTLPLYWETPHARIVHAFFEPGVALDRQRDVVLCGTLTGENYLKKKYPKPWYEMYDGPPIVVGHRNYSGGREPFVHRDRVYGIDTHGYGGGALTGIVLPDFRFVAVRARKDHWAERRRAYAWLEDLGR